MRPREATASPMIDPPKKATDSAAAGPSVCAAVVVRTLALVAVYMPNQPAPAEDRAPATNAQTVSMPSPDTNSSTRSPAANRASIVYSRRMNTMAPSWMASAIFLMAGSPSS